MNGHESVARTNTSGSLQRLLFYRLRTEIEEYLMSWQGFNALWAEYMLCLRFLAVCFRNGSR